MTCPNPSKSLLSKIILVLILFFIVSEYAEAQLWLQVEKINSSKRFRYKIGDEITYKIKEFPETWYTDRIESLNFEHGIIGLSTLDLKVNDILALKKKNNRWLYHFINGIMLSSSITSAYNLAYFMIQGNGFDPWNAAFIVIPIVIWYLNKTFFQYRTFYFEDKYRLRIIDLNFYSVPKTIKP
jgi:hypothetical protein